jgi:tetratricopeptide (TPR) repeat protein
MTKPRFRKMFWGTLAASALVVACGWDPSRPFERESPEVREAVSYLDAGDAQAAGSLLEEYLSTGQCKEGNIGTPPRLRTRSNGSFDLGLALFKLAEKYGRRFGDEEIDAGIPEDPALKTQRSEQVDCALKVMRAIATDLAQPVDLRARARYLEGNLLFLNAAYEEAVRAYDAALELAPGMHDSGPITVGDAGRVYNPDLLGRDAAWNRAIALRRIEDKKDAGNDGGNDGGGDSGSGDGGDKNDDKKDGGDKNDDKKPDAGKDGGGGKDAGGKDAAPDDDKDKDKDKPKPDGKPDAAPPPPPSRQNQDERMLDQLENAPTVQQETAKKMGQRRRVRGMNDK